jgi:hypothetical protein
LNTNPKNHPEPQESVYGDDVKLKLVRAEKNLSLFLNEHVDKVETDRGRIRAVISTNTATGRESRFAGRWLVDATGDGTVGYLAGADCEVTKTGHMWVRATCGCRWTRASPSHSLVAPGLWT